MGARPVRRLRSSSPSACLCGVILALGGSRTAPSRRSSPRISTSNSSCWLSTPRARSPHGDVPRAAPAGRAGASVPGALALGAWALPSVKDDGAADHLSRPGAPPRLRQPRIRRRPSPETRSPAVGADPAAGGRSRTPVAPAGDAGSLLMRHVHPVWQDAPTRPPTPTRIRRRFRLRHRCCRFTGATRDIRSGKIGYAWVIDAARSHHQRRLSARRLRARPRQPTIRPTASTSRRPHAHR
jgi:hypothetical protein